MDLTWIWVLFVTSSSSLFGDLRSCDCKIPEIKIPKVTVDVEFHNTSTLVVMEQFLKSFPPVPSFVVRFQNKVRQSFRNRALQPYFQE